MISHDEILLWYVVNQTFDNARRRNWYQKQSYPAMDKGHSNLMGNPIGTEEKQNAMKKQWSIQANKKCSAGIIKKTSPQTD